MRHDGVEEFGFNLGMWTARDGKMLSSEDSKRLDELYPEGGLLTDLPVFLATGDKSIPVWPSHTTQLDHMEEFIVFLRSCGGFAIY